MSCQRETPRFQRVKNSGVLNECYRLMSRQKEGGEEFYRISKKWE